MKPQLMARLAAILTLCLALCGCASEKDSPRVRIATTTSIENSGLLNALRSGFLEESGIELEAHVVGSGKALDMARRGDVSLVLTHEAEGEAALLASGGVASQAPFMWNEFLLVGPASDPAGARSGGSLVGSMLRVHEAGAPFVSRGDRSGTHVRERMIWNEAGVDPAANPAYRELGQGMSALLRSASELQAYTLTDEATFAALSRVVRLVVVGRGGDASRNVYRASLMTGAPDEAQALYRWLVSPGGQGVIERFGEESGARFHPAEADENVGGMSYDAQRKRVGGMGHSGVESGHQRLGPAPQSVWQS